MNPYASEDFNRIKVKTEPKPKQEDDGMMDHPLFEGKKIDMNKNELKAFTSAMGQPEFKQILSEYVKEISDPNNRVEQEQYLRQLEEQGDLPVGTKLIKPIAAFCIKTISKKLISDINKNYFDQKTFINVCMHEYIQKPQREYVKGPNGQNGNQWQLPYSVSKLRHDQDKNGVLCSTFDVVFNRDIGDFLHIPEFKKFVSDTAIDGVNRVLAEHKEKCSTDYKILKNLKCKGGEPGLLTVKVEVENKLLQNADMTKHETKLQKEVTQGAEKHKEEVKKQEEEEQLKAQQEKQALAEIDEEDSEKEEEEPMPKSVVQPKYKIVYSYPVELQDHWEGPATDDLLEKNPLLKIPKELTVTINVPHIESMKLAQLDINDTSLIFEYPNLYYLDLNLKYKCDPSKGNAKHDKTKKTLTIRVPVVGLTEDSQRAFEENFRVFQERKKKFTEETTNDKQEKNIDSNNLKNEVNNKFESNQEVLKGESKAFLPPLVISGESQENQDQYKMMDGDVDLQKLKQEALEEDDSKGQVNDREQFLKIYKENNQKEEKHDERKHDNEIKFKQEDDEDEESHIKITGFNNDQYKPLIQEIKDVSNEQENLKEDKKEENTDAIMNQTQQTKVFDWDKSEKVEAKYQFLHQKEFVFVNLNMKGYNKQTDIRYSLSSNEILIEVKDKQDRVHRLCKTLQKEIDIAQSSIELLVDFICLKLKKMEKDQSWDQLGYDISQFTIPKKGQMKSNFLTYVEQKTEKEVLQDNTQEQKEEENQNENKENIDDKNYEQELKKMEEKIKGRQICHMNLESSIIFKIY